VILHRGSGRAKSCNLLPSRLLGEVASGPDAEVFVAEFGCFPAGGEESARCVASAGHVDAGAEEVARSTGSPTGGSSSSLWGEVEVYTSTFRATSSTHAPISCPPRAQEGLLPELRGPRSAGGGGPESWHDQQGRSHHQYGLKNLRTNGRRGVGCDRVGPCHESGTRPKKHVGKPRQLPTS
jgi:hypothetical protein